MSRSGPLVTVVVAAFNAERTIGDAVRSVLAQTCKSFELLICDDGSSDGTVQVVEAFDDSRVKLLKSAANEGPGPARDRAIACACGAWITFLDADDQYVPSRLETLLRVAIAHPDDIVADAIMDCHDTPSGLIPWSVVWSDRHLGPADASIRTLTFGQFLEESRQLIKPLLRRQLVMSLKSTHGAKMNGEDVFFLLPFFAHGCVIRYVPQPLYLYRMTPGSLSTRNPDRFRIYREVFEEGRSLFSHDRFATRAIDAKIESIRRLENYQAFLVPLRSGHLLCAWRAFLKEPWVVKEFVKKIFGRLPFHVSRAVHRGKARKVG